jgi:hypothetical protein
MDLRAGHSSREGSHVTSLDFNTLSTYDEQAEQVAVNVTM